MKSVKLVVVLLVLGCAVGAMAAVLPVPADSWTESSLANWGSVWGDAPFLSTDAKVGSNSVSDIHPYAWPWEMMTRFNLGAAGVPGLTPGWSIGLWYKATGNNSSPWPIINLNDGSDRRTRWYLGAGYGMVDDAGTGFTANTWQHWTLSDTNKTYSEAGFDPSVLRNLDFDFVYSPPNDAQIWIDGLSIVVPEPATMGLLLGGVLLAVRRKRA